MYNLICRKEDGTTNIFSAHQTHGEALGAKIDAIGLMPDWDFWIELENPEFEPQLSSFYWMVSYSPNLSSDWEEACFDTYEEAEDFEIAKLNEGYVTIITEENIEVPLF